MISKCLVALMLIGVAVSRVTQERSPLMISRYTGFETPMCDDSKNVKQAESGMKKFLKCHKDLLSDYSEKGSHPYSSKYNIEGALYVPIIEHVCDKKDEAMKCYADLIDAIAPCANFNSTTTKIDMKNVVDFVCMDDGARTKETIETIPQEAAQVVALLQQGLSQQVVASQLHLSQPAVSRVYRRYQETGAFTGRPTTSTSEREDRLIVSTYLLTKFIMDGGIDCMRSKMLFLESCEVTTADINTIMKESPSEQCEFLRSKSKCMEDLLEDCPKPSTASYFSRLAKIIIHSECEEAGLDV